MDENDELVIYNINEMKKVMLNLANRFHDVSLKNGILPYLVKLHKWLDIHIECVDGNGYIYKVKGGNKLHGEEMEF